MTIGIGVAPSMRAALAAGARSSASSSALLLLRLLTPTHSTSGRAAIVSSSPTRHAGLVVVVVGTQELDAQAGQRLFEGLVQGDPKQEKAVHDVAALGQPVYARGLSARGRAPTRARGRPRRS